MKRFLAFLLVILLAVPAAGAVNLSDLTFAEKQSLYEQLSRSFDKSFELPPGIYAVGTDIKVGTYRFMYDKNCGWFTRVRIGSELNISKTDLTSDRQKFDLWDPYADSYWFQLTEAYYRLKDGDYIVVEYGDVRMEPMEKDLKW